MNEEDSMAPRPSSYHPAIGTYVRELDGSWWAQSMLGCLDYPVRVRCSGSHSEETAVLMFQQAITKLPGRVMECVQGGLLKIEDVSGMPSDYSITRAHIESIKMASTGEFRIVLEGFEDDIGYEVCPCIDLSAQLELVAARWIV